MSDSSFGNRDGKGQEMGESIFGRKIKLAAALIMACISGVFPGQGIISCVPHLEKRVDLGLFLNSRLPDNILTAIKTNINSGQMDIMCLRSRYHASSLVWYSGWKC